MAASFTVDAASPRQKKIVGAVACALCIGGLASALVAGRLFPEYPAFLPVVATAVTVADLITSFLLIAQFRLVRTSSYAVLGAAFLFSGLTAAAQLAATPGILSDDGLLGEGDATATALWLYWHGGFAIFVLVFAVVERRAVRAPRAGLLPAWLSAETTTLVPIGVAMIAILIAGLQPAATGSGLEALGASVTGTVLRTLTASALVVVVYATRGRTVADLALAFAALASLFDVLLSVGAAQYSGGWYLGRVFSLVSSCSVLLVFLAEVTELYARTVALNARLEKIANSDGLTGLPNRRQFDERLATEWRGASRRRSSIGMLMIDVDFFKRYNDRYGHLAGDDALRNVAGAIRDAAKRMTDLPARYGGEEFAVILPDTELAAAAQMGEAIRGAVRQLAIPHDGNAPNHIITVSVGVAAAVPMARLPPELLTRGADQALYRAKRLGRDQIAVEQIRISEEVISDWSMEPERSVRRGPGDDDSGAGGSGGDPNTAAPPT